MDHRSLFAAARPLLRGGGGIAIVTNGIPLWLHETDWSKAVRAFLERWLDTSLSSRCGTDPDSQRRYAEDLQHAGYTVTHAAHDELADLDFEHLAGGVLSALPASAFPRDNRHQSFMRELRDAVGPEGAIPRASAHQGAHRTPLNRPAEECGSHEASAGARGDVPSRRDFSIRLAAGQCRSQPPTAQLATHQEHESGGRGSAGAQPASRSSVPALWCVAVVAGAGGGRCTAALGSAVPATMMPRLWRKLP